MPKKDDFDYLSSEEYEIYSFLPNEHREQLSGCSDEDIKHIIGFPANKRRVLLSLSRDKFHEWKIIHEKIRKLRKRYSNLEKALDDGQIPQSEYNQTYANLRDIGKQKDDAEKQEQQILAGDTKTPRIDIGARPGILSIRPLPPDRDFTPPKKRKNRP
jgi:hypothetical protein